MVVVVGPVVAAGPAEEISAAFLGVPCTSAAGISADIPEVAVAGQSSFDKKAVVLLVDIVDSIAGSQN